MIRLFVALALPDTVLDALGRIMSGVPGARWEPRENLHLTLRFIGEVDNAEADDILQGLAEIEAPAFDLQIKSIGHFDDKRAAHALWAGVAPCPALGHLRNKIESLLVRTGLEPEKRKFLPHVTLARLRETPSERVAAFQSHHNLMAFEPFRVGEFHLFSSRPGKDRAAYRIEASYALIEGI